MNRWMSIRVGVGAATLAVAALLLGAFGPIDAKERKAKSETGAARDQSLSLIVMDPLAGPLSCPCVDGYAQRKYEKLAKFLEKHTGKKVRLTFSESLSKALKGKAKGRADLIIGKDSVVRSDAKLSKLAVKPVAFLTGKDGKTTQTGLIVVPSSDDAQSVKDLKGYRLFFGPADCDEKHSAPMRMLRAAGISIPKEIETSAACSAGAARILELRGKERAAAVISSYAQPLLEGCGTIKKGDLRVIGETKPVPFISAFTTGSVSKADREAIELALLKSGEDFALCKALESLIGFVPLEETSDASTKAAPAKKK